MMNTSEATMLKLDQYVSGVFQYNEFNITIEATNEYNDNFEPTA